MKRSPGNGPKERLRVVIWGVGALALVAGCMGEAIPGENEGVETTKEPIVGGSTAVPYSFPFQVYLYITGADGYTRACGGALLNQRWVITAAHCVDDGIQGLYAFLGMHHVLPPVQGSLAPFPDDYESFQAVYPPTSQNVVFHPSWDGEPNPPHWDMALLKLNGTVTYTDRVKAIAVAPVGATGSTYATGWGATNGNDPDQQYSEYLKVAGLPVRSASTCNNSPGLVRNLYSDEICAGYPQGANPYKGTCFGDSGGPFFRQSGSTRDLLGVSSWGSLLCTDYVVFSRANTTSTRNWITTTIAQ